MYVHTIIWAKQSERARKSISAIVLYGSRTLCNRFPFCNCCFCVRITSEFTMFVYIFFSFFSYLCFFLALCTDKTYIRVHEISYLLRSFIAALQHNTVRVFVVMCVAVGKYFVNDKGKLLCVYLCVYLCIGPNDNGYVWKGAWKSFSTMKCIFWNTEKTWRHRHVSPIHFKCPNGTSPAQRIEKIDWFIADIQSVCECPDVCMCCWLSCADKRNFSINTGILSALAITK